MSRSVLVVDDEGDLRHLVRIALAGHDQLEVVGEAGNGADAVAKSRALGPDLVVLDLGLPDLSDQEVISHLRDALPHVGIVVFTASTTPTAQARNWGADELVRKDADIDRLVHALEELPRRGPRRSWRFPAETQAVRAARHRVADELRDHDLQHRIIDTTLVVSELASNAVVHAATEFVVRFDLQPTSIRVEVHDEGPGVPEPRDPDGERPGGRGLLIVASVSTMWGTESTPTGKWVWAELPR